MHCLSSDSRRSKPSLVPRNVAQLVDWLASRSPAHAQALEDRVRLRAAVDQVFVGSDASIAHAREVALFPPVTGG